MKVDYNSGSIVLELLDAARNILRIGRFVNDAEQDLDNNNEIASINSYKMTVLVLNLQTTRMGLIFIPYIQQRKAENTD